MDGHGASLTAFALYQSILDFFGGRIKPILIKTMFYPDPEKCERGRHYKFIKRCCEMTEKNYLSANDFRELSSIFDMILLGSDQVFRVDWVPKEWYLNDVEDSVKKIAVSASFGTKKLGAGDALIENAQKGLRRFYKLSVREEEGIETFKRYFFEAPDIQRIIDPVFWLDKRFYEKLLDKSRYQLKKNKNKNIFFCFLDQNQEIEGIKNKLLEKGYNIYEDEPAVSAEDFLYLIKSVDYIITDSFHTMCFSIIFNKQFIGIYNQNRGSSRIDELKSLFKLPDLFREVKNMELFDFPQIDYDQVNEIIFDEANKAKKWMRDIISL